MSSTSSLSDAELTADGLTKLTAERDDRTYLEAIWARRAFLLALPREEIRSRHQDTLLGSLWHLANPLLSAAIYYLIFGVILSSARRVDNYIVYMMIGVFCFNLTSRTVASGAKSISGKTGLIRSMRFPRAMLPISTVLSHSMTFSTELIVLCCAALLTGEGLSARWVLVPVILGAHSLFNLGLVFYVARLNEAYRDIQNIVPFVFRLLMYMSGAMFPLDRFISRAPAPLAAAMRFNPVGRYLDLYRWALMGYQIDTFATLVTIGLTGVILISGFHYFKRAELLYGRA